MGPRNHVLGGGSVPTGGMGNFWGISPIMKIGNMGVGAPLVSVGVASTGTVGASASIIFPRGVMGVGAPLVWVGWRPPRLSVPLPPLSSLAPQKSRRFS